MKKRSFVKIIGTVILLFAGSCFAKYSGGEGTPRNPYIIADINDLLTLAADTNDYNDCFILINDINLAGYGFTKAVIAPDTSTTYGFQGTAFSGIFNGNSHVVQNININNPTGGFIGLFGYLSTGSRIRDLGVEDVNIAGYDITGSLVGENYGIITSCYSTGTVSGSENIGGLIGRNNSGNISYCYNSCIVSSDFLVGGLIGFNDRGDITYCYNTASVNGFWYAGGLVGENCGSITGCYNSGQVSGETIVGGITGENTGSITNCYNTGEIDGSFVVGGLIGSSSGGSIINCYSAGQVGSGGSNIGGLAGGATETVVFICNFWDVNSSQITDGVGNIEPDPSGVTGRTTVEMYDANTYITVGWDFDYDDGDVADWSMQSGSYPILTWQISFPKYSGGSGEPNDPYRIWTISDWQELTSTPDDWDKNFVLIADIDLQDFILTPVGNDVNSFTGVFDGYNYVIYNAYINIPESDYVGLFGYTGPNSVITDLGIVEVNITGNRYVGGLAGCTNGSITGCYSAGVVNGSVFTGGLAGENAGNMANCYSAGTVNESSMSGGLAGRNSGSIVNCYSTAAVSGSWHVGGLAGDNYGSIADCYSTTAVSGGNYYTGGLVGYNYGGISNCYSKGTVDGDDTVGGLVGLNGNGGVINCFWDIETSGLTASEGGRGLSTEKMKEMTTYSLNGWATGDWTIDDGSDYPHLAWENAIGLPIAEPVIPLQGDGTAVYPYEIENTEDLQLLSFASVLWDRYFILVNNLDLTGILWTPVGDGYGNFFNGIFDGNDHKISNLVIDAGESDYIGLFGCTGPNSVIINLGIEDVNIIGDDHIGGLAGLNSGSVNNCYSEGTISGNSFVGCLVGINYGGNITDCCSEGIVYCDGNDIGGLVGVNSRSSIMNCYSTGVIKGNESVGGLIGHNYQSSVLNCYSIETVIGNGSVGGLIGYIFSGNIRNCYSSGMVNQNLHYLVAAGGLAGINYGSVINCYSMAAIDGNDFIGGLAGINYGSIENCYSTGMVDGNNNSGGLIGYNYDQNDIIASFWDVNSSGLIDGVGSIDPDPNGVTGLSTAQMQDMATFVNAGWDFDFDDGDDADWFIQVDEYPILTWQISPADIYTDGRNNFRDFAVLAQYWLREDCSVYNYYCDWADLDFDGFVSVDDLMILMDYWLEIGIYD